MNLSKHTGASFRILRETDDGRPVNILKVNDEFTRELLATNAAHRIAAAGMKAVRSLVVNNE